MDQRFQSYDRGNDVNTGSVLERGGGRGAWGEDKLNGICMTRTWIPCEMKTKPKPKSVLEKTDFKSFQNLGTPHVLLHNVYPDSRTTKVYE